jgi:hypothetical protein
LYAAGLGEALTPGRSMTRIIVMARKPAFGLIYDPDVRRHLAVI